VIEIDEVALNKEKKTVKNFNRNTVVWKHHRASKPHKEATKHYHTIYPKKKRTPRSDKGKTHKYTVNRSFENNQLPQDSDAHKAKLKEK
jgi:hypothetical protein